MDDKPVYNHVSRLTFGEGKDPFDQDSKIFKAVVYDKVEGNFDKTLSLLEAYDEEFELFDHSSSSTLASTLYQHPEEDPVTGNRQRAIEWELLMLKAPEFFGCSVEELLAKHPMFHIEHLTERLRKVRSKELNVTPPPTLPDV